MVMHGGGGSTPLSQDSFNSTSTSIPATASYSSSISSNYPLISSLLAFAISQSYKIISSLYKGNRWDLNQIIGSGGMPSSHSATVTALVMAVGFQDGFGGSQFATALILAFVVMYDATGVRLHAGRQAEVLNQIVLELPAEHPLAETTPLRELLGHTPPQVVVGATLGMFVATVLHILYNI